MGTMCLLLKKSVPGLVYIEVDTLASSQMWSLALYQR